MSDQTTLSPTRGEVITSVEPDAVFLEARNAYLLAQDALAKGIEALSASEQVAANASNALSQVTTAISLANTAQTTANNALASQVSITGASMTGPLYVSSVNPSAPYEAAAKGYVDAQVSTVVTDGITSVANLKADKTYVDNKDADLQAQINTGATQITDLYTKVFPVGGIILWSGSIASIPTGWKLCDGLNGTPNLRDRFIIGAGTTYGPGNTGGATRFTTSFTGSHTHGATITPSGDHTHTVNVLNHRLTVDQMPTHNHYDGVASGNANASFGVFVGGSAGDMSFGGNDTRHPYTSSTGGNQPHKHDANSEKAGSHSHNGTILSAGDHSHTVDVTPPYYALAYIMRVA
jgi:hypothetical protein